MAGADEKPRSHGLRANIVEKTDTEIIIGYQVSRRLDAVGGGALLLVSGLSLVEGALALWTLGPFVNSFCTELGKRFGGTVGDWASQVHLHRKRRSRKADLFVNIDDTVVVLDLGKGRRGLSDDAMLAFLDLDFKDQAIRGHRLTVRGMQMHGRGYR
jgi:hypothetical protein